MKALFVAMIFTSRLAAAEPAFTGEIGGTVGGVHHWISFGGALGAEQRILRSDGVSLWLHESYDNAVLTAVLDQGSGKLVQGRIGLEGHFCGNSACGVLGVEAGYQHEEFMGTQFAIFSDGAAINETHDNGIVAFRFGLDLGSDALRLRPIVDIVRGPAPATGGDFSLLLGFGF